MTDALRQSLVAAAAAAQPALDAMDLDERLIRAARSGAALARAGDEIVDLAVAEAGQPRRFARRELESAIGLVRALPALAEAIRPRSVAAVSGTTWLEWRPYGVVFGWHAANSPIWVPTLVALSALVGANAVIARPSSRTRQTSGRALAALAAPWPPGAVVVANLPGPVAEPLVWHPGIAAVVTHASTETCKRQLAGLGQAYQHGAPLRPYIPEASGNDALLVLPGADLDRAAEAIALAGFANSGQLCMAAKRIIVVDELWPEFEPRLVAAIEGLVVGNPDDQATDVAPIAVGARERARRALIAALAVGGRIVVGAGERDGVFTPTVIHLPVRATETTLWRTESFAPLRGLMVVADVAQAIALANDSVYGLGAAVFGGLPADVAALRAARIVVNESPLYQDAHLIVGGIGESGLAGARPKLEQLVWARRVHRAGGA